MTYECVQYIEIFRIQLFIKSKPGVLNVVMFKYSLHTFRKPFYTENSD